MGPKAKIFPLTRVYKPQSLHHNTSALRVDLASGYIGHVEAGTHNLKLEEVPITLFSIYSLFWRNDEFNKRWRKCWLVLNLIAVIFHHYRYDCASVKLGGCHMRVFSNVQVNRPGPEVGISDVRVCRGKPKCFRLSFMVYMRVVALSTVVHVTVMPPTPTNPVCVSAHLQR